MEQIGGDLVAKGTKKAKKGKINSRQLAFINEYVKTLNATQSAIKAGYSESGARVQGHRLLNTPHIRERIDKELKMRADECKVDTDLILTHLKEIALDSNILPKDRLKALDLLGRYRGMWNGEGEKNTPTHIKVTLKE